MNPRLLFTGQAVSPGRTAAQVCLYSAEYHHSVPEYAVENETEIERELGRLEEAVRQVASDLDAAAEEVVRKIGKAEAEIFTAQKHILLDPTALTMVRNDIRNRRKNAEYSVSEVFRAFETSFETMPSDHLRERARDIGDIRRRLLDDLRDLAPGFQCEGQANCQRGADRIIVTQELTPNMIAGLDFSKVRGFITEHGGRASHAAIIARSLGVPAVSGIHGLFDAIRCGETAILDGDAGTVVLNPGPEELRGVTAAVEAPTAPRVRVTPPGFIVMANASLPDDVTAALKEEADGIGLFRTEFLFIRGNRLLPGDEQAGLYSDIVRKMGGRPVAFRCLDVGGDKPLPFLSMEPEANPFLGWRGARFLLGNRELLMTQLSALAKASLEGPVRILFPMVTDLGQWKALRGAADEALMRAPHKRENLSFGPMFEVPSACLMAAELLAAADFGSIGSNDLIQYLFAVDRNNEHVSGDYNPDHPLLWKLFADIASAAKAAGKPLSICGEMASLPGTARRLGRAGIKAISVSPRFISAVRAELGGT